MGNSETIPIGEVITFSKGGGWGKEEEFENSQKCAIIRGADFPEINNGIYDNLPVRFEKANKVQSVALQAGDIILENSGGTDTRPTGRTVFVSQKLIDSLNFPVIPASFCKVIRIASNYDSRFVYYWLQDMYKKGRTWGYQNRSTGISNFQFKVFAEAEEVPVIPLDHQHKIATILSSLDAKIELNTKLNGVLEEMARGIWSEFEKNATDKVRIDEVAREIITGKTPSTKCSENYGDKYPFITIPDMHSGGWIVSTERSLSEEGNQVQKNKLVPRGAVLVSCIATVGLVGLASQPSHFNQQINGIIPKNEGEELFLYYSMQSIKDDLFAIGATGSATLNVNKNAFSGIEIFWPTSSEMKSYIEAVTPIFKLLELNKIESRHLATLRDTLLPKLMSGEIDVDSKF